MTDQRAESLVNHLRSHPKFQLQPRPIAWDGHFGAILVDTALQANRDYERTVQPCVAVFKHAWSAASTVSSFLDSCGEGDPTGTLAAALAWNGRVRPQRALDLARALQGVGIDTPGECAERYRGAGAHLKQHLTRIQGIGPKSVAYLSGLVGVPDVAVDVRLKRVLAAAGVTVTGFDDARAVIAQTAKLLEVDPWVLDGAMWRIGGSSEE